MHYDDENNINTIRDAISSKIGNVVSIEKVYNNQTYKVTLQDRIIKAKIMYYLSENMNIHQHLLNNGVKIIKIVDVIDLECPWKLKCMEWIDGHDFMPYLSSEEKTKQIPPATFYAIGELLASIANFPYSIEKKEFCDDGELYIGMADIILPQFIMDKNNDVYLVDATKLQPMSNPERWFFFNIFSCDTYTTSQKSAFVEGYLDKIIPRKGTEALYFMEVLIDGLQKKWAESIDRKESHEELARKH